jgi:DNA polymerase-3 subunit epsilon
LTSPALRAYDRRACRRERLSESYSLPLERDGGAVVTLNPTSDQRRQARADAARWAAGIVARADVVYLDTETTGIDGNSEIVEIAVIDADGQPLLDTLVRPDGIIPLEVIRIHGIDDIMVASSPRWTDVYPELLRLVGGRTVVVYNAEFDLRLVNQMNRRAGFLVLPPSWHCAMKRYAAYTAVWNEKYGNYRFHKLDVALAAFGHRPADHRARADALSCRLVVHGMAGQVR